ncbi:hypothetical protein [Methanosphaera sp.]
MDINIIDDSANFIGDEYDKRSFDYKYEHPYETKILEQYEKEIALANSDEEIEKALEKAKKALGLKNDLDVVRMTIKMHGDNPYDIKFFEKLYEVKY